jgi:hypothetical protein
MHAVVLQTLKNQDQEIAELKQLLAAISGKPYKPADRQPVPNLKQLHPRGDERFQEGDLEKRWHKHMHHNPLVSALREDLTPHTDE